MKSAYNSAWLRNLSIVNEAKRWRDHQIITGEQFTTIAGEYKSSFYHPNLMIRLLLFVASLIGLGGVTGILILIFANGFGEHAMFTLSFIYGIASFVILDRVFIARLNHYKSGVTEALLYHAIGYTLLGLASFVDFNDTSLIIISCLVLFSVSAWRFLDLISTACAVGSFAYLIFYEMYQAGGIMQQIIPIVFIIVFTPLYFLFRSLKGKLSTEPWHNCLVITESLSLMIIYASGNYFVVRELSVGMMGLSLEERQDIPFAYLFYFLTVVIPIVYLYFGLKNKDIVLLRVSLLAIAFSVFTFKYYFSLGHPEITLTIAGVVLLGVSLSLFKYLKAPKHGYTRENLLKEKWADANPEAFVIAQTLGGNQVSTTNDVSGGGGGQFGGGGSSDSF